VAVQEAADTHERIQTLILALTGYNGQKDSDRRYFASE
jgi:hypothetical protein